MRIQDIETKVTYLLNQYPDTRDSDGLLMFHYVKEFYPEFADRTYIDCVTDRAFPNSSSVCRARRKLQERHEELRGERWLTRNTDLKEEFVEYAMADKMHAGI